MKAKFYSVLVLALFVYSLKSKAQNAGDVVFAGTQVHTINMQFTPVNYWDSLTFYYNQGLEKDMMVTVTLNGVVMDSVGVRFKGNSSYSHPNNKKPFKVDFNEYVEGQGWDDLKSITLNNCFQDPTLMREKLHYDFCRDAGVTAPRANYVNLYINGVLWGLYTMVESVDSRFLSSRFGNNDGNLFKAVDAFGSGIISDLKWYGSTQSSYSNRYELKTNEEINDWTDLILFLDTLNNNTNVARALPTKINLNSYYKTLATDILFANLDAYVNSGRNFYFYDFPNTGKFEWIVWDCNMSFGSYAGGVTNFETMSVTYVSSSTNRPLINKIYGNPQLKSEYLTALCYLFKSNFSSAKLNPKIDSIANKIRPYVYADTKKQYTNANFETNIVSDLGSGGSRKPGLKSFITARSASITSQLNTLGINCDLAITPGSVVINEFMAQNDSIADPSGQYDDWIEIYNNTNVALNLGGLYLTDNFTIPSKWQFPANTMIAPKGYLIVWADEDSGQVGLHASFKLSVGGERIRLSNVDASVLDTITFPTQTLNRTMARKPNGTGSFVQGLPTFNQSNNGSLSITAVIEGLYDTGSQTMRQSDTATVYLRNSSSPYNIVDSAKAVLDMNTFTGSFNFLNAVAGNYYVVVKHRNSLETWSSSPVSYTGASNISYDFTPASAAAYGNNLVQLDNSPVRYGLYSGEVNRDGAINLTDVVYVFNDVITFVTGYKLSDINGDNITNLQDVIIANNNSTLFINVKRP